MRSPALRKYFPYYQHTTVVCGGGGLNKYQRHPGDGVQPPLLRRFRLQRRLKPSVRHQVAKTQSGSTRNQKQRRGYTMATVRINDVNIYYESHGSGFPLVFVYGLGGNTGMWAGQIDAFAPHYRFIVWDPRGHGKSE